MNKRPDDPRWCPMLEAIKLRTAQLGDRDLAILDLEQAIESGKLRGMRWSCASGESRLTAPFRELFAWVNGYAYDDWMYCVWKPDLDALPSVSQADPDGDSDSKGPDKRDGWQVKRIKALLLIAFPDGVPADATNKEVQRRLVPLCESRRWKLPSPDSISRARGHRQ
jgi:hypothetical protein